MWYSNGSSLSGKRKLAGWNNTLGERYLQPYELTGTLRTDDDDEQCLI